MLWFLFGNHWFCINKIMPTNTYTAPIYDKRLQAQTFDWMAQFDEHVTHACTFTMEQFDSELTAEQAWKQWECFCKYLNRKLYGNKAKRKNKTLLILATLEGEISYKKLHIHAAIGCIDRDYSFEKLNIIIKAAWRDMKWAKHKTDIQQYRDTGWFGYILKESVRLDLNSVDLTRSCVPAQLKA